MIKFMKLKLSLKTPIPVNIPLLMKKTLINILIYKEIKVFKKKLPLISKKYKVRFLKVLFPYEKEQIQIILKKRKVHLE